MRALYCLDPKTSFDRIEQVTSAAGLDAVVVAASADTKLRTRLSASQLRVVLNVPLFFAPEFLAEHPECYAVTSSGSRAVADWLHMACPSSEGYWRFRMATLEEQLADIRPDLISLDFARTFVRWEKIRPETPREEIEHGCCCAECLRGLPEDPTLAELALRRTDLVTARVREVSALIRRTHPGVPLAVKVVPWLMSDHEGARAWACGQDLRRLGEWVDLFMPMSYSSMIGRPAEHIGRMHREIRELTGLPVMPWLQAADADDSGVLPLERILEMLAAVERDAEHGYCIFHLDGIADRPQILALLASRARHPHLKELP